jgi:hypothetical protein
MALLYCTSTVVYGGAVSSLVITITMAERCCQCVVFNSYACARLCTMSCHSCVVLCCQVLSRRQQCTCRCSLRGLSIVVNRYMQHLTILLQSLSTCILFVPATNCEHNMYYIECTAQKQCQCTPCLTPAATCAATVTLGACT